jgi:hypothetical protein
MRNKLGQFKKGNKGFWLGKKRKNMSGKNHPNYNSVECVCHNCGKVFLRPKSQTKNGRGRFCSINCLVKWLSKAKSGEKSYLWKGGHQDYRGVGWRKISKEMIKKNKECFMCGKKNNLITHHIIPYRIEKNNDEKNLMVLCNSCHRIVENDYYKDLENTNTERLDKIIFYNGNKLYIVYGDSNNPEEFKQKLENVIKILKEIDIKN